MSRKRDERAIDEARARSERREALKERGSEIYHHMYKIDESLANLKTGRHNFGERTLNVHIQKMSDHNSKAIRHAMMWTVQALLEVLEEMR